jgi:branched-chain amino acid transport system ATP-binding protein
MSLLSLDRLTVRYGEIEAVHGLSLSVEAGEVVTLLGGNGAGKSTTLRAISGLLKPAAGEVTFDGQSIVALGPEAIVKLGIAHVPEGRRIFPGLSARENIMLGASNRGRVAKAQLVKETDEMFDLFPDILPFAGALGWSLSGGQQQMVAVARGLMAKPRLLKDRQEQQAGTLSGGEQQMLAIGRGLMSRPRLLLLDEPSLGLAPVIVQKVFAIIAEIRRRGTTVLLVEQNARMALSVAERGYVLETGRLALSGKPADLWSNEAVRAAYLGGGVAKEA